MKGYFSLPVFLATVLLGACRGGEGATSSPEDEDINGATDPAYLLSRREIVEAYSDVSCESLRHLIDYLDQVGSTDYFRGLSGELVYQPQACRDQQGPWNNLDQYLTSQDAIRHPSKIYLSKLDVPTRAFNLGFPKLDGTMIQTAANENLVEYFSLQFRTELKLGADDQEGDYEFAVLADDGVRMEVGEGSAARVYLAHPEHTPTKMVCSTQVVTLSRLSSVPVKLSYFQGPRQHIALMLLWRKAGSSRDPLCGSAGNDLFFNSNVNPSAPRKYNDLVARGWRVVPAHVFRIPRNEYMNPCESDYVRDVIDDNQNNNGGIAF